MNNTLRSIGAVLTGVILIVFLSIGTDYILEKAGFFPDRTQGAFTTGMLALAFAYRTLYSIAGGYVTAVLAPNKRSAHAIALGILGTITSAAGAIVAWDLSDHWYPLALVITALPATWLGGTLRK